MLTLSKLLGCFLLLQTATAISNLRVLEEWKEMEFNYPDEALKATAAEKQFYVRGNSVPIDVDVFYKRGEKTRIFVTIPRFSIGRPMTLGVVTKEVGVGGSKLEAYPDYSWHDNQGTNCDGMSSVFRISIDACSRLWVLDAGKIGEDQVCPPQLLLFDLNTDTLLHRHRVQPGVFKPASLFITPVVDVRNPNEGCSDTFVYMADVSGFGMAVFDLSTDTSWRIESKLFYPYPTSGTFEIDGENFDLMDGAFGLALSPLRSPTADRFLYFHSLASHTENKVNTAVLRNSSAWTGPFPTANPRDFELFRQTRPSQAAAQAMDRNGILYFGMASPMSISCWDITTPFGPKNFETIAQNSETLQFVSGIKVVNNLKGGQELWALTCRFQKVMTGSMVVDEVNFRIQAANIDDLVRGTKCARPNGGADLTNLVGGSTPQHGSSNYGGVRFP